MGFLARFFGKRDNKPSEPEHAVLVYFEYGSTDLSRLFALEEQLEKAIGEAGGIDSSVEPLSKMRRWLAPANTPAGGALKLALDIYPQRI